MNVLIDLSYEGKRRFSHSLNSHTKTHKHEEEPT